ncbi:MAG: type II toxin-antitoxin system Phd/YefM family antitoxin [Tepidisphaeraceae bacterium]
MTTFSTAEAEKQSSKLLEQVRAEGEVRIKGVDGQEFMVRPVNRSPLDVGKVDVKPPMTADEIVRAVREGRERG